MKLYFREQNLPFHVYNSRSIQLRKTWWFNTSESINLKQSYFLSSQLVMIMPSHTPKFPDALKLQFVQHKNLILRNLTHEKHNSLSRGNVCINVGLCAPNSQHCILLPVPVYVFSLVVLPFCIPVGSSVSVLVSSLCLLSFYLGLIS